MKSLHPLGTPFGNSNERCQTCAWSRLAGPGPKVLRCVASGFKRVNPDWLACQSWEAALDCLACAACCGPAFDVVVCYDGETYEDTSYTFEREEHHLNWWEVSGRGDRYDDRY